MMATTHSEKEEESQLAAKADFATQTDANVLCSQELAEINCQLQQYQIKCLNLEKELFDLQQERQYNSVSFQQQQQSRDDIQWPQQSTEPFEKLLDNEFTSELHQK